MAVAAIAAVSAASAEQLAARNSGSILPVTRVIERVEAQPDFGAYQAMHYDRSSRSYAVLYRAKDGGAPRLMLVDAVTGRVSR